MRKSLQAGLLLLLAWAGVLRAERVQDLPRPANYVNDFAGVLSPGVQNSLNALCTQVDQAHAQIAVVTIKTLDGEPIENFATELEEKWKVGPKGSDRGVLLILAINDRQRRIEVGYGLEGILPDAKVGDIGRQMVPYLRQANYNQAVVLAVTQMAQIIAADAGVNLSNSSLRSPPEPQGHLTPGGLIGLGIFFVVILLLLSRLGGSGLIGFLLGMFLGGGGRGGGMGGGWGGGGGGGNDSGGFGGFGGGGSGGGGASGDW
jgi:uncharacterized protein